VLAEVCELSPDVRLGQLLAHLGFLAVQRYDSMVSGRRSPRIGGV
jgi:hypothetical protein